MSNLRAALAYFAIGVAAFAIIAGVAMGIELTNLAAPELPEGAAASVVTSSDGERLAILWAVEGGVIYVESREDGGWSASRRLPTETLEEASGLVAERLR